MIRLGVTGGIGSGKSTVARLLAQQAPGQVLDADQIARSVTLSQGAAMPALVQAFGAQVVARDGSMDRAYVRQHAFSDPAFRARLEAIIHPLVQAEMARCEQTAAQSGVALLIYDIPLLVESGHWRERLDAVLVSDCTPPTQIQRVQQRNGLTAEEVHSILANQAPRNARLAAADYVIFNDGISLVELEKQCQHVCNILGLQKLAKVSA